MVAGAARRDLDEVGWVLGVDNLDDRPERRIADEAIGGAELVRDVGNGGESRRIRRLERAFRGGVGLEVKLDGVRAVAGRGPRADPLRSEFRPFARQFRAQPIERVEKEILREHPDALQQPPGEQNPQQKPRLLRHARRRRVLHGHGVPGGTAMRRRSGASTRSGESPVSSACARIEIVAPLRRANVGDDHGIHAAIPRKCARGKPIADDRPPGATPGAGFAVDHADDLDLLFGGTQRRDLGQLARAIEHDAAPSAGRAGAEQRAAVAPRATKEIERGGKIFRCETALLGKAAGREIIGITIERHLPDLDEPLLGAAPHIGVDEAEGDVEFVREMTLSHAAVALHGAEDAKQDSGIVHPRLLGPPSARHACSHRHSHAGAAWHFHAVNVNVFSMNAR